jgi:hypothetical protein
MSDIKDIDNAKIREETEESLLLAINKANALQFTISTEGWKILVETFQDMKEDQLHELYRQTPGNEKAILAAHSVWFSVVHTLDEIVTAIDAAIHDGEVARQQLEELRTLGTDIEDTNWL